LGVSIGVADAKPKTKKLSKKALAEQVRTALDSLADKSNPEVRQTVFRGRLELGGKDRIAAVTVGVDEKDWVIRIDAMSAALNGKDRKAKKKAQKVLTQLLESADETDRNHGVKLLTQAFSKKKQVPWLQSAAKNGSKDARQAARALLLKRGGKVAWKVIKRGLQEPAGEPEYGQAVEALKTFRDPDAVSWALTKVYDDDVQGVLAREYLRELKHRRSKGKIDGRLKREYRKYREDFPKKLRAGYVLAGRGYFNMAKLDLVQTFFPAYRAPEGERLMALKGLKTVRDVKFLNHMISQGHKLSVRKLLLSLNDGNEVEAAYAWLYEWAKYNSEPEIYNLLKAAVNTDRTQLRVHAMQTLGKLEHRESVLVFEAGMREGRKEIRLAAARGLAGVAKPGDEKRLGLMLGKEPDAEVKLALIAGLDKIGTPEIIGPLQFVLTDRNLDIKRAVASALAKVGGQKASSLLGILKRDANLDVRFFVWHHLLKSGDKQAMKEFELSATSWMTPAYTEILGNDKFVPIDVLTHLASKGSPEQQMAGIKALQDRGEKAATRLLTVFETARDESVARRALEALSEVRGVSSLATYRKALGHKFGAVRAEAYAAIGAHGSKALLTLAQQGLMDQDPLARAEAARATWALGRRK